MLGAIVGDIVGSRFEFDNLRSKDFDLWGNDVHRQKGCTFTDDSLMTIAVADAVLQFDNITDEETFKETLVERMHYHGKKYPDCGFGGRFYYWIMEDKTKPYNSYGNGSAMRVSPAGWAADSLADAEHLAKLTSEVTHNHPDGISGAQSVAAAIFMARKDASKDDIKKYITEKYYPEITDMKVNELRKSYQFTEKCSDTVPQAFTAFFESDSFEDTIRTTVSIGGDTDTLAAISCGIAEAYYGIPDNISETALSYLDPELKHITEQFRNRFCL